jgi:Flp pilus assembly protein TadG
MRTLSTKINERRGTACVEAAVTLPLLLVLVFGSIEASNAIFLKQSLTIAAYEAAKAASAPSGTDEFARTRCAEALAVRDITSFTITFSPANIDINTARGQRIIVTVTLDSSEAAVGPLWIYSGKRLTKRVEMVRL